MGRVLLKNVKKYLFIPYENGVADQIIQIRSKSKEVFSFYYPIASNHISGWGRIELPSYLEGETVEVVSEQDKMVEAVYTRERSYGKEERHQVEPWVHFHIPYGKILEIKSFFQDEKENWHMHLLEDFSMGSKNNEGILREYKSKDLYYWEEGMRKNQELRAIGDTENLPLVGDVTNFFSAADKNGEIYGFALSKQFCLRDSPVKNVLSIPVNLKENKIYPMKKLENLRVWRRDWYLKKIEKEFYFECRFRIRPGEWPGIIIEEKARTLEDIRAGVIEVELEVLVGMEEEILIELSGLQWKWSALTQELRCKDYVMPATVKDGRLLLHFFCDHIVQEGFSDSGKGMLVTYPEIIKEIIHDIQNDEIENIQNPTFQLRYYSEPYIKIQTKGNTASIVAMHVYALRRPDYSQGNVELLENITVGERIYQCSHFTVYENAIDDMVYGSPKSWVLDRGTRVLSPIRAIEDFQWANTPWGDMTRIADREEMWRFRGYEDFPQLETGIPTVDAAYNLAVDILQRNLDEAYAMPGNEGLLNAGLLQGKGEGFGVWVRDTCHNAFRIANFLIPDRIRKSLVYVTKRGFNNGCDSAAMPPIAIWDYYRATSDKSILYETYSELFKFIEKADSIYDKEKGLIRAEHSAAQDAFPEIHNGGYSLSPQIYYAHMYFDMANICDEIQKAPEKSMVFRQKGEAILSNIKRQYWNEEKSCFTSGPRGSEAYEKGIWEATGAEACVWPRFHVADSRQRREFLQTIKTQRNALNDFGLNWYPFEKGKNHFWNTCWVSWTEGIAVAANHEGDIALLRKLIFQQVRNVVVNKTFHEAVDYTTGKAWRWPGLTWHASAFLGYFVFGLLGISYEKEGLTISPCIPQEFSHMKLCNLRYREAVFEIEIEGSGNQFDMYVDDSKTDYIDAAIKGRHRVTLCQKNQ